MARHPQRDNEDYSEEEAQRRFLAAVKAGLNTKPKPLKSIKGDARRRAPKAHQRRTSKTRAAIDDAEG